MVRSQTYRTVRIHDTAIAVTCPKCKACSKFPSATNPKIDSCGFESYSFQCTECASAFAGIVDLGDGELVLSLLEQPSGVSTRSPTKEKRGSLEGTTLSAAPRSPF
jgi:hypothetical protein